MTKYVFSAPITYPAIYAPITNFGHEVYGVTVLHEHLPPNLCENFAELAEATEKSGKLRINARQRPIIVPREGTKIALRAAIFDAEECRIPPERILTKMSNVGLCIHVFPVEKKPDDQRSLPVSTRLEAVMIDGFEFDKHLREFLKNIMSEDGL